MAENLWDMLSGAGADSSNGDTPPDPSTLKAFVTPKKTLDETDSPKATQFYLDQGEGKLTPDQVRAATTGGRVGSAGAALDAGSSGIVDQEKNKFMANINSLVESNQLPNNPTVLQALINKQVDLETVKERHKRFLEKNYGYQSDVESGPTGASIPKLFDPKDPEGKRFAIKNNIDEMVANDQLPNSKKVLDAIISGEVPLNVVREKHALYREQNPIETINQDRIANAVESLQQKAYEELPTQLPEVGKQLYSSPTGKVYENFQGGFAATSEAAYKEYEAKLASTTQGAAQLNLMYRKADGLSTDPMVETIARPEIGKAFLGGLTFGVYKPEFDDLTPEQAATVMGLELVGNGYATLGSSYAISSLPVMQKLAASSAGLSESISTLKTAKTTAQTLGLTEEAATLGSSLLKQRVAKGVADTALVGIESFGTGFFTGAGKSAVQGNGLKDIFVDGLTEGTLFTGLGLSLLPVAEGAGMLFNRTQAGRTGETFKALAKVPEVQDLARGGATPEFLQQVKSGISPTGPYTPQQASALSAIEKIENTKPLLGMQSALMANPEILKESFDQSVRKTSQALFGPGGQFEPLLQQNKSLQLLFEAGKHGELMETVQGTVIDQIRKNPEAQEHILAPFAADASVMNKVYANRMLKGIKTPEAYPNLQKNLLNYLSDKSTENAELLKQSAPRGFMRRLDNTGKYFDPRLNSKEIDVLTGDIMENAFQKISGAGPNPLKPNQLTTLTRTDDILSSAITFNKELNRGFIEAYQSNPFAFDENFVQVNPELIEPVQQAAYLKTINQERNVVIQKRRELSLALNESELSLKSATDPTMVEDLKRQITVLKDKRRTLNITFANQNKKITEITSVLNRLPQEQQQALDEVASKIFVPRRNGEPFAVITDRNAELGSQISDVKRQMVAEQTEEGKSRLTAKLDELRRSRRNYLESAQSYKNKFGKDENPFFVAEGSELADAMNSFMASGTDLKDNALSKMFKLPFGFNIENPRRILQKEFGYNNVFEKMIGKVKDASRFVSDETKYWSNKVDELGIRPKSKESKLLQQFGEGRLKQTDPEFLALPAATQTQLVEANQKVRGIYDSIIDTVNDTMRRNNLPTIPKMDNFYTHFQYSMDSIPNRIKNFLSGDMAEVDFNGKGGLSWKPEVFNPDPKTTFFRSAKKRKGSEFVDDAITGLKGYIPSAMERIFYTDLVREIDTARHFAPNKLGDFLQSFKESYLLKAPDVIDQMTSGGLKKALNVVRSRLGSGAIPGNVGVVIQQVLSMPQNFSLGLRHGMKALTQMATKDGEELLKLSKNLPGRDPFYMAMDREAQLFEGEVLGALGINRMSSGKISVAKDKATEYWRAINEYGMKVFDGVAAKHAYLTGVSYGKAKGLTTEQAAQFGDKWLEMIQADPTRVSQPKMFQSTLGRSFGQFQSFTTNFAASIMNDLPKIASTEGGAQAVGMIMKSIAGMSIANETARSIGIPAPFDLETFVPFYGTYRFGPPGELSLPFQGVSFATSALKGDKQETKKSFKSLLRTTGAMAFTGAGQVMKTGESIIEAESPGTLANTFDRGYQALTFTKPTPEDKVKAVENKVEGKIANRFRYNNSPDDPFGGTKAYTRDLIFGRARNESEEKKIEKLKDNAEYKLRGFLREKITGGPDKRKRQPPWLGRKKIANY